jgi:hypothetical protein
MSNQIAKHGLRVHHEGLLLTDDFIAARLQAQRGEGTLKNFLACSPVDVFMYVFVSCFVFVCLCVCVCVCVCMCACVCASVAVQTTGFMHTGHSEKLYAHCTH